MDYGGLGLLPVDHEAGVRDGPDDFCFYENSFLKSFFYRGMYSCMAKV